MQLTTANVDQFAGRRILLLGDILRVGLSGDEECKNEGNVESHLTTPCQVGRRRVRGVTQAGMKKSPATAIKNLRGGEFTFFWENIGQFTQSSETSLRP